MLLILPTSSLLQKIGLTFKFNFDPKSLKVGCVLVWFEPYKKIFNQYQRVIFGSIWSPSNHGISEEFTGKWLAATRLPSVASKTIQMTFGSNVGAYISTRMYHIFRVQNLMCLIYTHIHFVIQPMYVMLYIAIYTSLFWMLLPLSLRQPFCEWLPVSGFIQDPRISRGSRFFWCLDAPPQGQIWL